MLIYDKNRQIGSIIPHNGQNYEIIKYNGPNDNRFCCKMCAFGVIEAYKIDENKQIIPVPDGYYGCSEVRKGERVGCARWPDCRVIFKEVK